MSRSLRKSRSLRCCSLLEVKSKYGAEFRRFSLDRLTCGKYKDFYKLVVCLHHLRQADVVLAYADVHGELLPINNDDNLGKALTSTQYLLRIFVQLQEEAEQESRGVDGLTKRKKPVSHRFQISLPQNFRPVSSIIDVDIVPESHRRVRLYHQGSDRPLGFYIRDGASVRVTRYGLEKVPGIFISRIVPGGLADCTGLLAINDEVLEVNGIDVLGKSLDQVTDMMIANSHKLIVTVKPANQRNNIRRKSGSSGSGFMESMSSVSYPGLPVIMKAYCAEFESEDVDVVVESPVASLSWLSSSSTSSFSPCLKAQYSPNVSGRHHPAVRERSSSPQDVLNTWHVDLTRNLLLPQTAMEEDGIVVIL